MKTKFTLKDYNHILAEYGLKCVPEYGMVDDEIINKRKNYNHYCFICDKEFKTTPSKLLKSQECVYEHYVPGLEQEVKILSSTPVEPDETIAPILPYVEPKLSIQQYIKNLPIYIKYKDSIRSLTVPLRHRCNKCKQQFTITPSAFHECHYKCPNCQ